VERTNRQGLQQNAARKVPLGHRHGRGQLWMVAHFTPLYTGNSIQIAYDLPVIQTYIYVPIYIYMMGCYRVSKSIIINYYFCWRACFFSIRKLKHVFAGVAVFLSTTMLRLWFLVRYQYNSALWWWRTGCFLFQSHPLAIFVLFFFYCATWDKIVYFLRRHVGEFETRISSIYNSFTKIHCKFQKWTLNFWNFFWEIISKLSIHWL